MSSNMACSSSPPSDTDGLISTKMERLMKTWGVAINSTTGIGDFTTALDNLHLPPTTSDDDFNIPDHNVHGIWSNSCHT